jgi:hypothetical protein
MQLHDAGDGRHRRTAEDQDKREGVRWPGGEAVWRWENYWEISEQRTRRSEPELVLLVRESNPRKERSGTSRWAEHGKCGLIVFRNLGMRLRELVLAMDHWLTSLSDGALSQVNDDTLEVVHEDSERILFRAICAGTDPKSVLKTLKPSW